MGRDSKKTQKSRARAAILIGISQSVLKERDGGSCFVSDIGLKWLATVLAEMLKCKLLSTRVVGWHKMLVLYMM